MEKALVVKTTSKKEIAHLLTRPTISTLLRIARVNVSPKCWILSFYRFIYLTCFG